MTTPILQLLNVESNYGPVQALRGVSLAVEEGKIVTVLGANGAGKTTTLKTISGIIDPLKGHDCDLPSLVEYSSFRYPIAEAFKHRRVDKRRLCFWRKCVVLHGGECSRRPQPEWS